MKNVQPELYSFLDAGGYLRALLKAKARDPAWSLRALSRRLGLQSPSTLGMLVAGKRPLSKELAEKLATALKLSGKRRRYWLTLAELSRTRLAQQKIQLRTELMHLKSRSEPEELELARLRFLSEWYFVAIFSMLSWPNPPRSVEEISSRMKRPLLRGQITQALAEMERLGLIRAQAAGWEVIPSASLQTPDDFVSIAIQKYHRDLLTLAQEALQEPLENREFLSLTLNLKREQIPELKKMLRRFCDQIETEVDCGEGRNQVFQLGLQLFPLTHPGTCAGEKK